MNIFLRELKANLKALIIWSVCMVLLIMGSMEEFTAYSSSVGGSNVFDKMPYSIKALMGMGSFDITTMAGYFAMLFVYIELASAIHAVLLGSGIIAKEERDKTTEFLMVKPVSRINVITSKFFAALVNVLIINLVSFVSSLMMVNAYNKGEYVTKKIVIFFVSMFIVQIVFLSLGAALASVMKKPKVSGAWSAGILMGSFIIAKITDLTDKVNVINVFSPFKYFSYKDIVDGKSIDVSIVVLCIVLVIIFVSSTYLFYKNRDLKV
ncbi:ABC transporter permease subunit [Ruminiclostridium josui]|uniref:ABC transporter permease subunit n=1 Tax=Ruminiclostridium josui TaxID=1499 RepID=UPI00046379ED|nr:ABC transporter permease subunit [Ruminiclostridium josui]